MSQGRQFFCQMNVTVTSILFKWTGSHVFLSHILILILLSTVTKNNFMLFLCPLTELQIFEDSCHVSSLRPLFSGEKLSRLLPLIFFFIFFSLSHFLSFSFIFSPTMLHALPSAHHSGCPSLYCLLFFNSSFKICHPEFNTILIHVV